tara:strand:+ start:20 stop:4309 length:4290 start_codon:yes stop_codon:yes gene_type:complete
MIKRDKEFYDNIYNDLFKASLNSTENNSSPLKEEKVLLDIQDSFSLKDKEENNTVRPKFKEDDFYENIYNDLVNTDTSKIDYNKLSSDISIGRKLAYGARQEPTILGSTWRLAKAGVNSLFSGKSFDEEAKRIEAERQEEIFKDYPEFRGKEEDLTVLSGRMSLALADPVTFLVPWTKIAKAGKIATMATGATISAADIALREKALYGEINLGTVALGAGLGAGSSGIGLLISNKIKSSRYPQEVIALDKSNKPVIKKLVNTDPVFVGPLQDDVQRALNEVSEATIPVTQPFITRFQDNVASLGERYTKRDLLTKELKKLKELKQFDSGSLPGIPSKGSTTSQINKISKEIDKNEEAIRKILFIEQPENIAMTGIVSFMEAYKRGILKGKVGENLSRAFIQELVRPLAGATGMGAGALLITRGEISDEGLGYAVLSGLVLGRFNKHLDLLDVTPKLKKVLKTSIDKEFTYGNRTFIRRLLAGGEAGRGTVQNEVMRKFSSDLYSSRGRAGDLGTKLKEGVEELRDRNIAFYLKQLDDILIGNTDDNILAAGRIMQEQGMLPTSRYSFLQAGDLDNVVANDIARKLINLRKISFGDYVKKGGLNFEEIDNYGLTQILDRQITKNLGDKKSFDILYKAYKIQNHNEQVTYLKNLGIKDKDISTQLKNLEKIDGKPIRTDAQIKEQARNHLSMGDPVRRKEVITELKAEDDIVKLINNEGRPVTQNETLVHSAGYINKERSLYDPEARAFAKELFIQDPAFTLSKLFRDTVPIVEFSRRYGSKGQGLNDVITDLKNFYNKVDKDANLENNSSLRKLLNDDLAEMKKSVNVYFGVFEQSAAGDLWGSELSKSIALTLQTILATTKLGKVAIPSIGDLIQTMQNSGYKTSYNSLIKQMRQQGTRAEKPSAMLAQRSFDVEERILGRKFSNRRYNGTLERELNDFAQQATTPYQRGLLEWQQRFFEFVQLGRVTRFAREFAYDSGAFRAFDLSRKTKFSPARLRELNSLGLDVNNAKYLNQFKNIDDAYADKMGKHLIDTAGFKAANRDALIPQIGNRRLFAQSKNPWMKFAGSFLSWAMAKSTQTNSLLRRLEDGDAKLAVLMLSTLPFYATIRQLQIELNPNKDVREEYGDVSSMNERQLKEFLGDVLIFSGQAVPYWADKAINMSKYNTGLIDTIYPVAGIIEDLADVPEQILEGDLTSAAVTLGEATVPFAKEFTRRGDDDALLGIEALGLKEEIKDLKGETIVPKARYTTGGLVSGPKVPFTKENPADRINPITDEPYQEQMDRLGFAEGEDVSVKKGPPLHRKIYGLPDKMKAYMDHYGLSRQEVLARHNEWNRGLLKNIFSKLGFNVNNDYELNRLYDYATGEEYSEKEIKKYLDKYNLEESSNKQIIDFINTVRPDESDKGFYESRALGEVFPYLKSRLGFDESKKD